MSIITDNAFFAKQYLKRFEAETLQVGWVWWEANAH